MLLQSGKENPTTVVGRLCQTQRGKNVGGIPVFFKNCISQDLYLSHRNYSTFVAGGPHPPGWASGIVACTGTCLQQKVALALPWSVRLVSLSLWWAGRGMRNALALFPPQPNAKIMLSGKMGTRGGRRDLRRLHLSLRTGDPQPRGGTLGVCPSPWAGPAQLRNRRER